MDKIPCVFCGLPVRVSASSEGRPVYCCSGCALAAQIPMDGGNLPISRQLVVSLAIGFIFFNQFLFWALAVALRGEDRAGLAFRFDVLAIVVGGLVLAAGVLLFAKAPVRRWGDWLGLAVALAFLGVGVWLAASVRLDRGVLWIFGANAVLLGFLGRGWVKRFFRRGVKVGP